MVSEVFSSEISKFSFDQIHWQQRAKWNQKFNGSSVVYQLTLRKIQIKENPNRNNSSQNKKLRATETSKKINQKINCLVRGRPSFLNGIENFTQYKRYTGLYFEGICSNILPTHCVFWLYSVYITSEEITVQRRQLHDFFLLFLVQENTKFCLKNSSRH